MQIPRNSGALPSGPVVGILVGMALFLVRIVPATVYVDGNASGSPDGTSWTNAYPSIQSAIDDPRSATQPIWIAKGSYAEAIVVTSGRQLYGGFLPGAASITQRDPDTNPTTLDLSLVSQPNHGITLENVHNVVIDGIRVSSGSANGHAMAGSGGGMICDGADDTNQVTNCTFSDNTAADNGGAVVLLNGASPQFTNCQFLTNTATGMGGAAFCTTDSLARFDQCTFQDNRGIGGGIYATQTTLTVSDSTFSGNLSINAGGGAIQFDATAGTLTRCRFVANQANWGGGIDVQNGSKPVFDSCDFFYNNAETGGAVSARQGAEPQFNDCQIVGNTSAINGGGVACFIQGSVKMNRCVISGNSITSASGTGSGGAAVYLQTISVAVPSFVNCVISGNATTLGEAAIYGYLAHGDFQNCTVNGNTGNATTGGVYCRNFSNLHFGNCIFSSNDHHAVTVADDSSYPTLDTCLFHNNTGGDVLDLSGVPTVYTSGTVNTAFPTGKAQGNFEGDPQFVMDIGGSIHGTWTAAATYSAATDLTTFYDGTATFSPHAFIDRRITVTARPFEFRVVDNTTTTVLVQGNRARVGAGNPYRLIDYHLASTSDALDRGEANNAPPVDLDGNPRPVDIGGVGFDGPGQGYDVGAYEYQDLYVTASPAVVDFGAALFPGGTGVRTVALNNMGTAMLNYAAVIEDDTEGNFAIQSGGAAGTVPVNDSHDLTIAFSPQSAGQKSATLTFSSDGFPRIVKVYLRGTTTTPVRLWMIH